MGAHTASLVLQITGRDEAKAGRREHRKCHSRRLPLTTTPQAQFGLWHQPGRGCTIALTEA
jgi:hypothetical protein